MTGFDFAKDFSLSLTASVKYGVILTPFLPPRIFSTPDVFIQIAVYHNGRRLLQSPIPTADGGEYFVFSSTGGSGFDRVQLFFTPSPKSVLQGDYIVLGP